MARPLRIEFPGAIHHVTSRMVGSWKGRQEQLFRDDRDTSEKPSLAIGEVDFRQWVEQLRGKTLRQRKQNQGAAFRRVVASLKPGLVLGKVGRFLGVQEAVLKQRRRESPLRAVAARCLIRYGGQTQRQAAAPTAPPFRRRFENPFTTAREIVQTPMNSPLIGLPYFVF